MITSGMVLLTTCQSRSRHPSRRCLGWMENHQTFLCTESIHAIQLHACIHTYMTSKIEAIKCNVNKRYWNRIETDCCMLVDCKWLRQEWCDLPHVSHARDIPFADVPIEITPNKHKLHVRHARDIPPTNILVERTPKIQIEHIPVQSAYMPYDCMHSWASIPDEKFETTESSVN